MTPIPLSRSNFSTKILITLFLLTVVAAVAVAELNIYDKVGKIKQGIEFRYGPDQPQQQNEIPSGDSINPESFPKEDELAVVQRNTFSSLIDITHAHIFEIPLIIFVLAHFLMRTRTPEWFKLTNYLISFSGTIAFIGAPWLVRYISAKMAMLLYVGAIAIGVTTIVMVVVPIWDMWIPKKSS